MSPADRVASWLPLSLAVVAALLIATSSAPPAVLSRAERGPAGERFGLPLMVRQALFKDIADNDARWRGIALAAFPGDEWAQADHWTDHMAAHVRELAK